MVMGRDLTAFTGSTLKMRISDSNTNVDGLRWPMQVCIQRTSFSGGR